MISILMPVYNEELYLRECLDSILAQSEPNWELIAVDDSSIDQSFDLLSEYALKDDRIKVQRSAGKGIIQALRLAYAHSMGDFITRMDADDIMKPNKLELLKSALVTSGRNHVATGLVQYFSVTELGSGYQRYAQWLNTLTLNNANFTDIYKECPIPSPCWMLYREDFDAIGAFKSDDYPEDYDLCFRMAQSNFKVVGVDQILHLWRDYSERTSRNDEHYADHTFMDIKIKYFLKLNHATNRQLIIWGLGRKGKDAAKLLQKADVAFRWICDNPKKIKHIIYNTPIESSQIIKETHNMQLIILVANPNDQILIQSQLDARSLSKNQDYFFFC